MNGKRTDVPAAFAEVQALFAETKKLLERLMEADKTWCSTFSE
ncbi:hypothetical protein ABC383_26865 [Noviherbaspirillum sp. 1P10PC]